MIPSQLGASAAPVRVLYYSDRPVCLLSEWPSKRWDEIQVADTHERSPRQRLLDAAVELFGDTDIHAVGIDRLLRHAGVAKASMYAAFGSKDGLVTAYVEELDHQDRQRWQHATAEVSEATEKILMIFDVALSHQPPAYRGCRYLAVATAYAGSTTVQGRAVLEAIAAHRSWLLDTLTQLLRGAGHGASASSLAARLVLLYDGALAGAKLAGTAEPLHTARDLAATLLGR